MEGSRRRRLTRDAVLRAVVQHERGSDPALIDARKLAARLGQPAHEVAAWLRVCEQDGQLWLAVNGDAANPLVEALTPAGVQYARLRLRP